MGSIPEKALSIELLNARNAKYALYSFDSGDEELDDFLKNDALIEQKLLLSRTHLCFYKDRLAGTLSGWIKISWMLVNILMAVITLHIHVF